MSIVNVNAVTDERWHKLTKQVDSDLFHSVPWLRGLEQTYGFDIRALIKLDEADTPLYGLTYCRIGEMTQAHYVGLPFSDFFDPLVHNSAEWQELFNYLLDQEDLPYAIRCLHNAAPCADKRLKHTYTAKWHCIDLTPDDDTRWMNLHSSARRAIRKSEKSGVTVRHDASEEAVQAFFNLHLRLRKHKYHMLAQPYDFFHNIWCNFIEPGHGTITLAEHEGQVIGAVMFLEWNNKFYYKFNASDLDAVHLRPNDPIVWAGSQYAHGRGLRHLDFGISDTDQEGLIRYKQKFATEEKEVYFLKYTPDSYTPNHQTTAVQTLLHQLTDILTHPDVPDHIIQKAGRLLYRNFT